MDIDLEQLRELMRSIQEFGVYEMELEKADERIVLRRRPGGQVSVSQAAVVPEPAPAPATTSVTAMTAPARAPSEPPDPNVVYVTSPFVGTFYRAPSPDEDPFVEEGQDVAPGQAMCIIEAMKLMNEIESELACTILDILVENGKPVEYGDRLFKVRKK
jgi:acetyl-CoA carboxylase biotin carboxyl carrier protein